jgi:hypothetical protein
MFIYLGFDYFDPNAWWDFLGVADSVFCDDSKDGFLIAEGAKEEDDYDPVQELCNLDLPPDGLPTGFIHHFYPDEFVVSGLGNSLVYAKIYWQDAVEAYKKGEKGKAYWYLGRIAHLLADMSVPAHVHGDSHVKKGVDGKDSYELFVAENSTYLNWYFSDAENLSNTYSFEENMDLDSLFENLVAITAAYPSDDKDGTNPEYKSWNDKFEIVNLGNGWMYDFYIEEENLYAMADELMPYAILFTSKLYELFWYEVNVDIICPDYVNAFEPVDFKAKGKVNGHFVASYSIIKFFIKTYIISITRYKLVNQKVLT